MKKAIEKSLEILRSDEQLLRADKVQEVDRLLSRALFESETSDVLVEPSSPEAAAQVAVDPVDPVAGIGAQIAALMEVPAIKKVFDGIGSDRGAQHAELLQAVQETNRHLAELVAHVKAST